MTNNTIFLEGANREVSATPLQLNKSNSLEDGAIDGAVFIAMPSRGYIPIELLTAYMGLVKPKHYFLSTNEIPIDSARNSLVANFLTKTPDATHILFWDDDIIPQPDALLKLWRHNAPIVSGLYFRKWLPHEPVMGLHVTSHSGEKGFSPFVHWESGKTYCVDGIGMGFCLIRRDVFQNIEPPWFTFGQYSEDYMFCRKAIDSGYKIMLDTSVELTHVTDKAMITVNDFLRYKEELLQSQMFFR